MASPPTILLMPAAHRRVVDASPNPLLDSPVIENPNFRFLFFGDNKVMRAGERVDHIGFEFRFDITTRQDASIL